MKVCYIVYREENVMVFQSQVLEYLQLLKLNKKVSSVELILFCHEENLKKRKEVEKKISCYVDEYKTFLTIAPPLSEAQLIIDARRLKNMFRENMIRAIRI